MGDLATFGNQGYEIFEGERREKIDELRHKLFLRAKSAVGGKGPDEPAAFFNRFHEHKLSSVELNKLRLDLVDHCTKELDVARNLFTGFQSTLLGLVGPDVAAQRTVNLVIQQPGDADQVPIHRDAPSNSHFEVIVWLPLVDCFKTKSMFILNKPDSSTGLDMLKSGKSYVDFSAFARGKGRDLAVPYGSACFFAAGMVHGCNVNAENETRWSLNIRYKNLFSPYGAKGLLEFFEIISLSPLSRIGFDFERQEYGGSSQAS